MNAMGNVVLTELLIVLLIIAQRVILSNARRQLCKDRRAAAKGALMDLGLKRYQNLEADLKEIMKDISMGINNGSYSSDPKRIEIASTVLRNLNRSGNEGDNTILDNLISFADDTVWLDTHIAHKDGLKNLLAINDPDETDDNVRDALREILGAILKESQKQIKSERDILGVGLTGDNNEAIRALQHLDEHIPTLDTQKVTRTNRVNAIQRDTEGIQMGYATKLKDLNDFKRKQVMSLVGENVADWEDLNPDQHRRLITFLKLLDEWMAKPSKKKRAYLRSDAGLAESIDNTGWTNEDNIGRWLGVFYNSNIDWAKLGLQERLRLQKMAGLEAQLETDGLFIITGAGDFIDWTKPTQDQIVRLQAAFGVIDWTKLAQEEKNRFMKMAGVLGLDRNNWKVIDLDFADKYLESTNSFMEAMEEMAAAVTT